ncbi:uncharacterized protein LOC129566615 isoform X2 [Sitodiplosis mosellana]|uniref:uncharacterized protein LOC129566615 isoform X2 n=1 Tax=Sitodiplosis mosellana TaxID=263140 RepID=UPI002445181D|nr:uncharacterized protein LOC129566615 isoform X2 [Sitodiplosis mosellana]
MNQKDSYPYQFLPMKEGYVPVYIRLGEQPLNDINPELAVAFHEVAVNGRQLKSNDEFNEPQDVKVPQLEKKVDTDPKIEHVEPQPVEHKV